MNQQQIDRARIAALNTLAASLPGVVIMIVTVNTDENDPSGQMQKFSANLMDKTALAELFLQIGAGLNSLPDTEIVDLTDCKGGMQ